MAGLQLVSDQKFRVDGRKPHELRRIRCGMGNFKQADGSSYIEQGNTKVLVAVYGPHQVRGGKGLKTYDRAVVNCHFSIAVFGAGERKHRSRGDRKSQEMMQHVEQTFEAAIMTELYPQSQIDINIEVLQSDGGNYCACINAATLAIIDAGISIKDYVCSCTTTFVNDIALVDINYLEESSGKPTIIVSTLPKSGQIVFLTMNSQLHEDHLSSMLDSAIKGCKDIHDILDEHVRNRTSDIFNFLKLDA